MTPLRGRRVALCLIVGTILVLAAFFAKVGWFKGKWIWPIERDNNLAAVQRQCDRYLEEIKALRALVLGPHAQELDTATVINLSESRLEDVVKFYNDVQGTRLKMAPKSYEGLVDPYLDLKDLIVKLLESEKVLQARIDTLLAPGEKQEERHSSSDAKQP